MSEGGVVQAVELERVSHWYGGARALGAITLGVPAGSFYALLGPNGAGKTTLLRIVGGLLRPTAGRARALGEESTGMGAATRTAFTFVGESLRLPEWLRLDELESYLAPLYPRWDHALAGQLRRRFRLDPARRLRALSRGEQMKAALLCALAPRPRLLVLDEPFTGMDALVKDELVSGVLDVAASEGCTVFVASHDLAELELIADAVGFLDAGTLRLSEPMESLRARFRRVELRLPEGVELGRLALPGSWLDVEWQGARAAFLTSTAEPLELQLAAALPPGTRAEERGATLREIFVALAREGTRRPREVA